MPTSSGRNSALWSMVRSSWIDFLSSVRRRKLLWTVSLLERSWQLLSLSWHQDRGTGDWWPLCCRFWNILGPDLYASSGMFQSRISSCYLSASSTLPAWHQNRRTVALLCADYKVHSRPYWHELVQCLLNIPQMRLQVVGQGWRNGGGPSRESSELMGPVQAMSWKVNNKPPVDGWALCSHFN